MNSLSWLEGVEAKMVRAKEHLDTLVDEAKQYLQAERNEPEALPAENGNEVLLVLHGGKRPPILCGILLGECVYHMRSVLDNLICSYVRANDPRAICRDTQFPNSSTSEYWERKSPKYLMGVDPEMQKMTHDLQPCFRMPKTPENDPLNMLNELCNRDKHRAVALTEGYSDQVKIELHLNDGHIYRLPEQERLLITNTHTVRLNIDPRRLGPNARVEVSGDRYLAIQEEGPWEKRPVWEVLGEIHQYVLKSVMAPSMPFFRNLPEVETK